MVWEDRLSLGRAWVFNMICATLITAEGAALRSGSFFEDVDAEALVSRAFLAKSALDGPFYVAFAGFLGRSLSIEIIWPLVRKLNAIRIRQCEVQATARVSLPDGTQKEEGKTLINMKMGANFSSWRKQIVYEWNKGSSVVSCAHVCVCIMWTSRAAVRRQLQEGSKRCRIMVCGRAWEVQGFGE